jgi:Family of unknown function (DUF6176)
LHYPADEVRKWFRTLKEREAETLETLENEGAVVESVFLEKHENDFYLIYYMKAKDMSIAREVAKQSTLPIDVYHRECCGKFFEERRELELLVDFNNF